MKSPLLIGLEKMCQELATVLNMTQGAGPADLHRTNAALLHLVDTFAECERLAAQDHRDIEQRNAQIISLLKELQATVAAQPNASATALPVAPNLRLRTPSFIFPKS